MIVQTELTTIHEGLRKRFPQTSSLTQPLLDKLATSLYKQDRCEELLDRARNVMRSSAWSGIPAEHRRQFRDNVQQTRDRIEELKRLIQRYADALDEANRAFSQNEATKQ